jgi:uncharacterized membrane protein
MTALNQIDYIYKSNNNERRDNSLRYLYFQFFIRKIWQLIIFMGMVLFILNILILKTLFVYILSRTKETLENEEYFIVCKYSKFNKIGSKKFSLV